MTKRTSPYLWDNNFTKDIQISEVCFMYIVIKILLYKLHVEVSCKKTCRKLFLNNFFGFGSGQGLASVQLGCFYWYLYLFNWFSMYVITFGWSHHYFLLSFIWNGGGEYVIYFFFIFFTLFMNLLYSVGVTQALINIIWSNTHYIRGVRV